jgi:hypothetical protein
VDTNNSLALIPNDILIYACKNSKKELINLSSTNKLLSGKLNTIFEMLVPIEFRTEGESPKRTYMRLVNSQEELIERINDFIAELKPNIDYNFECGFLNREPMVKININNLLNSTGKNARFILSNNDLIPSVVQFDKKHGIVNGINFKYFSDENNLSKLDFGFLPFGVIGKLINKIDSVPRLQKIFKELIDSEAKKLNDIAHNKYNKPNFDFNRILNSIKSNNIIELYQLDFVAIRDIIMNRSENELKIPASIELNNFMQELFNGYSMEDLPKIFQKIMNLIQTVEAYSYFVTGDKFEIEQINFLPNSFDIKEFKKVYNQVAEKNKSLNDSILEIDKKFSLITTENRLSDASPILQRIKDFTFKQFPKLVFMGLMYATTTSFD